MVGRVLRGDHTGKGRIACRRKLNNKFLSMALIIRKRAKLKALFSFFVLFSTLCAFIISCKHKSSSYPNEGIEMVLKPVGSIELKLDSATGFYQRYIRYHRIGQDYRFSLLNPLINRIQVYHPKSGEMVWSLLLKSEGPNSVGKRPGAFVMESYDSIYVFDSQTGIVTLLNGDGDAIDQYHLMQAKTNSGIAFPVVEKSSPLIKIKHRLYASGIIPGGWRGIELMEKPMLKLDLKNDSLTHWLKRPSFNSEQNWGNDLMNFGCSNNTGCF